MSGLYIFDIDGTVADLTHRLHFIQKDSPDWEGFHDLVREDSPIEPVIKTCASLAVTNDIWFFTGRMERTRSDTTRWLMRNVLNTNIVLEMRPNGDFRSDVDIKQEMLDNMLTIDRDRLVAVFDDRERIVKMWRENGIQCYQVKDGDY